MTTYFLHMQGTGEGCDYAIGCNELLHELEATTPEEAIVEARKILDEDYGELNNSEGGDGFRVESVKLLMLCDTELDLEAWRREVAQAAVEADSADSEAAERAEYARLRKRFGDA